MLSVSVVVIIIVVVVAVYYWLLLLLLLLTLSVYAQEGYSSRLVCLSVCHALILENTDN